MGWNRLYSLRSYIKSSLWLVPFLALLFYILAIRLVYLLEPWLGWTEQWPWGLAGSQRLLETIITMTLTFVVFTFGSLLVAIQIAGGQLTPRIIATTLLRDNAIRFTVGLFIFTLLFATGALARLESDVHQAVVGVAGILGFLSIAAFLYLIDYAARLLRPVSIVLRVSEEGRAVIEEVYPAMATDDEVDTSHDPRPSERPAKSILYRGRPAIIVAVNTKALFGLAEKTRSVVELVPRVGDFVASGEPLFRLYGANVPEESVLRTMIAFGPERTLEQDATFAFRILVDIAIKALSKAINDPTTAVLAIDQLQRLLCYVGKRSLVGEALMNQSGELRVICRTPDWEDFVKVTFSEIRLYGAENFQIARRLRAVLEYALQVLPEFRHAALETELDLLDRRLAELYYFPEDLALARVADSQGLGGGKGSGASTPTATT
ncbi:DUF2254 domain-containing protein (plasmid) [Rhizobium grahamii]|uniref:DUF2254 domain-containing protein n=1 Tax=Rhizobium grahamii TaxID=1120045 RepID=A0A5Q0CFS9_9HYPH|nr:MULTISPECIES: DUF2254 domain-containing protein [Rhizobium]QFY63000.1 DUF2254 domain-containing protein [Rhizobium grahamii]QRM52244.1 DUF2254 domain-containing protein [Rhizobium sp. BG6]